MRGLTLANYSKPGTMNEWFKVLVTFFFGEPDTVPPPPNLSISQAARQKPIDLRQVAPTGQVFQKKEVKPVDKYRTGASTEWRDVTSQLSSQEARAERTARFTQWDAEVLRLPEFARLDVMKYKILKLVWAEGASNREAGKDERVKRLEHFKFSTRKPYYKALNQAHDAQQATLSRKEALASTP